MSVVELNAKTRVGQDLRYQTFKFQKFFLCHVISPLTDAPKVARAEHGRVAAGR
jgi:hypothetical protein